MNISEYKTLQKKTKTKRQYPEYEEQIRVVNWWYEMKKIKVIPSHYHLVYTDTSAPRTLYQRGRYVKMGGRAGVLDLFIPVQRCLPEMYDQWETYSGLWIEMKAPDRENHVNGGMSPEQVQFASDMARNGCKVHVCHSSEEAINEIINYLGLKL